MKKLMIEARDKAIFTHPKNLPMLIEFAKTFKAKLSMVESSDSTTLELEEIPKKFCSAKLDKPVTYELLEVIYPNENTVEQDGPPVMFTKTRSQIIADAAEIRKQIKASLIENGRLSMKELRKRFLKSYGVTDACLSGHFSRVRKELSEEGYNVDKAAPGIYTIKGKASSFKKRNNF